MKKITDIIQSWKDPEAIEKHIEEINRQWIQRDKVQEYLNSLPIELDAYDANTLRRLYEQHVNDRKMNKKILVIENGKVVEKENPFLLEQKRRKRLQRAKIPKRYFDKGFEDYSPMTETQRQIWSFCQKYSSEFDDMTDRGILLVGKNGTGKTHLLCAVVKVLIEKGYNARYYEVPSLYRKAQSTFDDHSPNSLEYLLERVQKKRIVLLDDIGKGNLTEWKLETLWSIIDCRYREELVTLISSNLTERDFLSRCKNTPEIDKAKAIWSRLYEMVDIFAIDGPDYRRLRR